jgi:hypothetical protein
MLFHTDSESATWSTREDAEISSEKEKSVTRPSRAWRELCIEQSLRPNICVLNTSSYMYTV